MLYSTEVIKEAHPTHHKATRDTILERLKDGCWWNSQNHPIYLKAAHSSIYPFALLSKEHILRTYCELSLTSQKNMQKSQRDKCVNN